MKSTAAGLASASAILWFGHPFAMQEDPIDAEFSAFLTMYEKSYGTTEEYNFRK